MPLKTLLKRALIAQVAAALAACGGGGDDTPATTPTPPAPASLTVGGTAATGAALAAASVQIKCAGGNGSATSAADGTFKVSITGASLPCVLSASNSTVTLHSLVESGSATTVTANVTPLTEIVTASVAGGDATALFNTFDTAAQAKLTSNAVTAARAQLTAALQGVIDLSGVDPLKDALVAANGGTAGNKLDQALDTLALALTASGTPLADLTAAVVSNDKTPAVVQTLLKPAASACAGLRGGSYRALDLNASSTALASARVTVDVSALSFTGADGQAKTLKDEGGCHFSTDSGATHLYVAKSGLALMAKPDAQAVLRPIVLVPEQTLPVSEVAGRWNIIGYGIDDEDIATGASASSTPGVGYSDEAMNDKGEVTSGADCLGLAACESWTPRASDTWTVDPDGGFYTIDPEYPTVKTRYFLFKGSNGQTVFFAVRVGGHGTLLAVAAKQQALSLPSVGQIDKFWDATITGSSLALPDDVQMTVQSVDTVAQAYTRQRSSDGRVDGFSLNQPRPGMRDRPAGSSQTTGGVKKFKENLVVPLNGLGLTFSGSADGTDSFGVSVGKP
ncbi:MAG TPA: hypothetical protein VGM81_03080 [Burkholderiaceae bacterium]|jgi:hypothetical protein